MTPTAELRAKIRRYIDDAGEDGRKLRFTDLELNGFLLAADNIYNAAADGWLEKQALYARALDRSGSEYDTDRPYGTLWDRAGAMERRFRSLGLQAATTNSPIRRGVVGKVIDLGEYPYDNSAWVGP